MKSRLLGLVEAVRTSYWLIPGLMALLALALGGVAIYLDAALGSEWLANLSWYQANKPGGAREVLSVIAASAITVAGVVFSITIVAISFAAGQFGPRLLTNFMSDRGNQVTLGTFVATFLYCLVVLRTIRSGDDSAFVPDIAVLIALVLALCSIAVLIYFIHHVLQGIHVNEVAASIGRRLIHDVGERFPDFIGAGDELTLAPDTRAAAALRAFERSDRTRGPGAEVVRVLSHATGYIRSIDRHRLVEAAQHADVVVKLRFRPGDFIHAGSAFAEVWPATRAGYELSARLRGSFAVGDRRTPTHDLRFLTDELVEIGARALSPGINDPFTAITCLDWLGAAAAEMARRQMPDPLRVDSDGTLRVVAEPETFESFVERAFGQLCQYVATDRNAAIHALRTFAEIAPCCRNEEQSNALREQADRLLAEAERILGPALRDAVQARYSQLHHLLDSDAASGGCSAG